MSFPKIKGLRWWMSGLIKLGAAIKWRSAFVLDLVGTVLLWTLVREPKQTTVPA